MQWNHRAALCEIHTEVMATSATGDSYEVHDQKPLGNVTRSMTEAVVPTVSGWVILIKMGNWISPQAGKKVGGFEFAFSPVTKELSRNHFCSGIRQNSFHIRNSGESHSVKYGNWFETVTKFLHENGLRATESMIQR